MFRNIFRRTEPTVKEISAYVDSISEEYARQILWKPPREPDEWTDALMIKAAAAYLLAKADLTGDAVKIRLMAKYRWKDQGQVHNLLTEAEIDDLLAHAKKTAPKTELPTDPGLRRNFAALVYDLFRYFP